MLARPVLLLLGVQPADGGWIEEDFGAGQSRESGRFGIPLVPADQRADRAESRRHALKAQIAGREIKFFVIERIVRDVHLPIAARQGAVGVEDHGRIVIEARRSPLEDRRDDCDTVLPRSGGQSFARRSGNRLRLVEPPMVFALARIESVEQLGQADDIRPRGRRFADPR